MEELSKATSKEISSQKQFLCVKKQTLNNDKKSTENCGLFEDKRSALIFSLQKTLENFEDDKIGEFLDKLNQEQKLEEIYCVEESEKKTESTLNQIFQNTSSFEKELKKRKAGEAFDDEELEKEKAYQQRESRKNEEIQYKPTLLDEIFQQELDYYESNREGKEYYHARQIFGFLAKKGHAPSK